MGILLFVTAKMPVDAGNHPLQEFKVIVNQL